MKFSLFPSSSRAQRQSNPSLNENDEHSPKPYILLMSSTSVLPACSLSVKEPYITQQSQSLRSEFYLCPFCSECICVCVCIYLCGSLSLEVCHCIEVKGRSFGSEGAAGTRGCPTSGKTQSSQQLGERTEKQREAALKVPRSMQKEGRSCSRHWAEVPCSPGVVEQTVTLQPMGTTRSRFPRAAMEEPMQ